MVVVDGTLQSNVVAKRSSLFKKTMVRNGQRSPAAGVEPRSSNVLQKRGAAEQCEDQDATLEISPKKWKRSSSSLGRSGGGESVENRAVWRKHFIKALRQIKAGKQRPNTRRLVLILNRDYGYNFQEIMNILDYCVEQGVALKAYVKGEYTYVDPKSESRHPLVITHNYNMSSRVLLAMSENPRGATKQYLIDYILKRFLIEPSGGITHEEVSKLIEKSIDQQIYSGVLQVKDKKSMFLVIESDYFANNLSTNKNFVNEVSLCKIIIKSEVVPVANSLMKCFYCNQSIQNDDSSLDLYISCKSCGKSIHSHHGMQSAYVLENFKNLHWECTECRRCCICRERRDKTSPADNYFTCSYCERIYHVECLGFYTLDKTQGSAASDNSEEKNRISGDTQQCLLNGAKEEDMKMCVICKNEKIFGNYSNLLNGLRNLNLKIDFKAHNNEVRQIIKSSSANQMRRTLFERHVVRNNKDLLPASKRYLKSEFDSDFHDIFHNCLNVPENEVELFKEAYEDSLMLSNTSKMVISETDSLMYPARIFFNDLLIKTQCSSPYPTLVSTAPILYVCDKCFDFFTSLTLFRNHKNKEKLTNTDLTPPGIPVYKEKVYESGKGLENLVVYEVDGQMSQKYCHDLCLFARSFLDHKTVYNNVEMFLFYVLTLQKTTEQGISTSKFVGYFSKEKLQSFESFNLSCIVVVPPYLKQGFGFFLIDFSYLISLKEMRFGSPEKPFSPLGLIAYSSYWKTKILSFLCKELDRNDCPTSIIDISLKTAIHPDDVLTTLEDLEMIVHDGDSGELAIKIDENYIEKINNEAFGSKKFAHEKNYIIKNCILHKELATFDRYKT